MEILKENDVYNHLTIVKLVEVVDIGHKHVMHKYLCKCSCGNLLTLFQGEIVSGHIKDCGCMSTPRKTPLKYDLTNQRFGRLFVIDQAETWWSDSGKSRMVRWNCICECGTPVTVNSRALRTGATLSCGCYQKQRVSDALTDDLTNQRFGKLTVIERAGSYRKNNRKTGVMALWKCHCDCGHEIVTTGYSLKCGDVVSCGCFKSSMGEDIVNQLLLDHDYVLNETYFREKTFPDLVSSKNGALRFDFAIKQNDSWICIECQGAQHYQSVKWFGGDDAFQQRLENDRLKQIWCKKHNVTLIQIPYTGYNLESISVYLAELINRKSE